MLIIKLGIEQKYRCIKVRSKFGIFNFSIHDHENYHRDEAVAIVLPPPRRRRSSLSISPSPGRTVVGVWEEKKAPISVQQRPAEEEFRVRVKRKSVLYPLT